MHIRSTNKELYHDYSAPQYQTFSVVGFYLSALGIALLNLGLRNQIRYKKPRARMYSVPDRHIGIGDKDLYHGLSIFEHRVQCP